MSDFLQESMQANHKKKHKLFQQFIDINLKKMTINSSFTLKIFKSFLSARKTAQ